MKDSLILNIAKCKEAIGAKNDCNHPCNKIVTSQSGEFQLPEPWNGHLDTAEILFISSNPSIDPNENYPTESWNNEDIISFFENRFDSFEKFNGGNQKYWYFANKLTGLILGKDSNNTNLLKEYAALTEIVHCKSRSELGVTPYCSKTCYNKWMREILKMYKGKFIVVVGKIAKEYIDFHLDKEYTEGKIIIYVPAHNARGITDEKRKQDILRQLGLN